MSGSENAIRPTDRDITCDGVNCTHSSCIANSLYKFELIIIISVRYTQCRVVKIQMKTRIETSLSDGVNRTHGSCVANLLYKSELIIINNVYSNQCRVLNIPSERLNETSLSE